MGYLLPVEYVQYGLGAETADALVAMASALMEAHCRRPSLMASSYVERVRITAGSQTARLSYGPLAAGCVTGLRVRYGRGRRGEYESGFGGEIAAVFGLPGTWTVMDPTQVDVDLAAREILFPTNLLGLSYNEAEVTYTAGVAVVPDALKLACAQIARNAEAMPALNVSKGQLDTMQVQYFSGSLVDESVQTLLRPYRAEKLG
ncbi:MAG: hypothetical protein ACRYFU_14885 [Janthinobacterium lividum]